MALRIKDGIDLKELEKFGFKYCPKQRNYKEHYFLEDTNSYFSPRTICCITCEDRQIGIAEMWHPDIIFDLIQAGLVEKVSD